MAKKSKSKKSKVKKTKSESPESKSETPDEAVSPSWSTDDVYNLLKAVNEVTLRRMEDKEDKIQNTLNGVATQVNNVQNLVVNIQGALPGIEQRIKTDLARINNWVNYIYATAQFINEHLPSIEQAIQAIKTKTDRLP